MEEWVFCETSCFSSMCIEFWYPVYYLLWGMATNDWKALISSIFLSTQKILTEGTGPWRVQMVRDKMGDEAMWGVHISLHWEALCFRPGFRSLPCRPDMTTPSWFFPLLPWAGCVCHCNISICHASDPPDPRGHVARGLRRHQVLPVPRPLPALRPTGKSCLLNAQLSITPGKPSVGLCY